MEVESHVFHPRQGRHVVHAPEVRLQLALGPTMVDQVHHGLGKGKEKKGGTTTLVQLPNQCWHRYGARSLSVATLVLVSHGEGGVDVWG